MCSNSGSRSSCLRKPFLPIGRQVMTVASHFALPFTARVTPPPPPPRNHMPPQNLILAVASRVWGGRGLGHTAVS